MQSDNNPFKAPSARVEDVRPADGYIAGGRVVPAGHGVDWLATGWRLFREAPGAWIAMSVVFLVICIVLGMIPIVNLVVNLLLPVFVGGIMLGCKAIEDGEGLSVGHLFSGFSGYAGKLVLVGVVYLVAVLGIGLVVGVGTAVSIGAGLFRGAGFSLGFLLLALVAVLLFVPLAMAVWYAPPLVVFHDESPFQAVKASFTVSLRNFLPFLVYGICFIVLAVLASIPLFLGWLVLLPVIYASVYAAYRDLFVGVED